MVSLVLSSWWSWWPLNTTIPLDRWETPASSYPRKTSGRAHIVSHKYRRGLYECYRTQPLGSTERYEFFDAQKPLTITSLKIGRKVWMVDDPPHWWGIQELAALYEGHVLCAGLGLGLIVHALRANPKVNIITVIENSADVINLIHPLIKGVDLSVINMDWWKATNLYNLEPPPDGIFFDLLVGKGPHLREAVRAVKWCHEKFPTAKIIRVLGTPESMIDLVLAAEEAICEVCGYPMSAQEYRAGFRTHDRCERMKRESAAAKP